MMVKQRKIIIALLLSLLMAITATASAQPADISGHWAEAQIQSWLDEGLASGYPDGTFKPNREVSRAEFVAMVNRAFGIESEGALSGFADVKEGQWFYADVMAAKAKGYFGGYPDGTFKPQNSISRQEAASSLARLLNLDQTTQVLEQFEDSAQIPQWSRGSVGALVENGLMGGYPDNTFKPTRSITRAEAVATLDRARNFAPGVVEDITLQGTVKSGGKAVSGAAVNLFEAGSYEVLKETETDANGHFEFKLAEGNYDITAVTNNKVAYKSDLELVQGEDATVSLDLEPAAIISGTLKDENDKIIKDATLFFTTNPTFVLQTGDDGKFTGAVLPSKTYTVRTYEPDAEDEEPVIVSEELAVGAAGYRSVGVLNAPFAIGTTGGGGGGGGGGGETKPITSISLNKDTLELDEGDSVALTATVLPSDHTGEIKWTSSNTNVATVDSEGNVTAVAAGKATITVASKANNDIKDTCSVTVYKVVEKELDTNDDGSLSTDLEKSAGTPVKIKTTVSFDGGDEVELVLAMESIDSDNAKLVVKKPESSIVPDDEPFVGLDISLENVADGTSVKVELPVPSGLNEEEAGAFHYSDSTQIWEYREATVVDGKVVFNTSLSPVAVGKKVKVPSNLAANYDSEAQVVNLSWTNIDGAKYRLFRDNKPITSFIAYNEYTDENVAPGTYTYYVKAYKIKQKGSVQVKFESKKSSEITITVPKYIPLPVDHKLPALLDAVEKAFLSLTDTQWEQLKSHRDEFLKNAEDEDITVEEIIDSLTQANLITPFERLINSNVKVEEARVTLNVIVSLSYLVLG
jgi:uncharacterized protein YjdB